MKDKILNWIGTGEVGASSTAMALAAVGAKNDGRYPFDPDDFNRCLLLLEAVPEIRQNMDKVAAINAFWSRLIEHWDELEKCFIDEVGLGWTKGKRAPKTYEILSDILRGDN